MTVRIGKMTFSDWVSLPFEDGWSDTFIFHMDSQACIPPFHYAEPLRRMAAHTHCKRPGASLWVLLSAPGEWFLVEVRSSLKGLALPYAVTPAGITPTYLDFSRPPQLFHTPSQHPPIVNVKGKSVTPDELRCLQALGRMEKGNKHEVASLTGLSTDITENLLAALEEKKLIVYKTGVETQGNKSEPAQLDLFPLWHIIPKGVSLALRSWQIPTGVQFTSRLEEHPKQIGYEHRQTARIWTAWLKSAWPQAVIWAGWSEVRIPGLSVIPDGLAWGRIQGYETLFWLEVGDGHKSRQKITEVTTKRLGQAIEFCKRTGVRLAYVQLSTNWVHEAARWACVDLPKEVAVVMGNQGKFGKLPNLEWGAVIK